MIDVATATFDELLEAGFCDCGRVLEGHPPLDPPKPWSHGRPCARSAFDRGRGWDGSPIDENQGQRRAQSARWGEGIQITRPAKAGGGRPLNENELFAAYGVDPRCAR